MAIQGRHSAVADILAAFLQGLYPEYLDNYIRFEGDIVDMILIIKPEWEKLVQVSKSGYKWLIGKLTKAIYGTLLAVIIFYKTLKEFLESIGFIMNPYNECMFNKTIDGHKCTI